MSVFFPRVAFGPSRCAPAITRNDLAPLFSLFDDTVNELARAQRHAARRSFTPRFDVKEAKESYHLEGELPGIAQENISIEFTDEHTLTIEGRSERHTQSGTPPQAVEATPAQEDGAATPTSEAASVKSRQPTVEDENAPTTTEKTEVKGKEVEKPAEPEAPKDHFWISERRVGEFTRSFSFADRVDQEAVKASLKNGILSIVVPKAPKPESRRINIE
jgi:HSP20 family protein